MHIWRAGKNTIETARKINAAWIDDTDAKRTARKWFVKCKAGENSLKDQSHPGRPQGADHQAVLEVGEENPLMKYPMLAQEFSSAPRSGVIDVDGEHLDY
ncbi:hypothetical protein KIN20_024583 [Parelaphostrongylus tenuis]|uniref:Mos1 transposase HTH domain-containing protein n=1 Tax=Parelaphostrongylus tenuis TaxID=148309 RepID=A0AAD5N222_PARTN|nr:hypothetical protein KIN20_017024 [Parelaphostrongylus tenuis]KAJ1358878.1 hypothetical protein KIN20_017431 [Parelaphostrongylus tenuis]KAJ1364480.1 hypothetical protein KIN20_024583 [Parelaphostrongylus tenuis]